MEIELDDFQKEVVNYSGDKFLCVEAGPGAGKTRVIVKRVKKLLKDVNTKSLLVITFTVKAAEELKDRLISSSISKSAAAKMQISTIHSFKILEGNNGFNLDVIDDGERKNRYMGKHML